MKFSVFEYVKTFGPTISIIKAIRHNFFNNYSYFGKELSLFNEKLIKSFLKKNVPISNNVNSTLNKNIKSNSVIWTMWWQGIEDAPSIVKACISSHKRLNPQHEVIVITKDNFQHYIKLPQYILNLLKDKKISITHFSDIVRVNLLYHYGGVWADSTLLMTKRIPDYVFKQDFYTIKTGDYTNDPSHGKWTTFFMEAQKGNKLMKFLVECFNGYLKNYSIFIDYILLDYFIALFLEESKTNMNLINQIPLNNKDVFLLRRFLLKNAGSFDYLNNDTYLYKLSYKDNLKSLESDGIKTIYKELIS
ncbi:capsular polysaccharide synthesis protein [Limosilactobacillus reuteri]|uniref:capsular polysaccharide synthesis protein n=1 Tax=Limosilactobacillus reuteri TaxID=1598 RepID=UPI000E3EB058|nr:capsular polysaccharide synthesis protein [Limosilactobacillus reuteri]